MSFVNRTDSVTTMKLGRSDSIEATSNPPSPEDTSDLLKDSDCGEPYQLQHLCLDFTPTEEDNDYNQRKCCAFWDFVNSHPELEYLLGTLDIEKTDKVTESGDYASNQASSSPRNRNIEKTAVSMLELVEGKGLIDRAFESRLPTSHCSLGIIEYQDEDSTAEKGECMDSLKQSKVKKRDKRPPGSSSPTVRDMCQKLKAWDLKHPKSMKPPGPVIQLEDETNKKKSVTSVRSCICQK